MKKFMLLIPILFVTVILLFSGCKKITDKLDITITTDETEITFTVNPSPAGDYTFIQDSLQSDLDQQIANNGGDASKIKSVTVNECNFDVVTPDRFLDEFKSVELDLNSTKVAWKDNIPVSSISEKLIIAHDDLNSILHKDMYTVTAKGTLDQELKTAITIKARIKYSVKVGLL
jgi:hypothetical protein